VLVKWPKKWRDLPIGGVINIPATSIHNYTGSWRSLKPIVDLNKCIKCLLCWVDCPDNSIVRREDDFVDVDYRYCKGCGICADVCPTKAISMVEEGE
jgi:pyruvate ferredoxin oxidoreductase delta subunit